MVHGIAPRSPGKPVCPGHMVLCTTLANTRDVQCMEEVLKIASKKTVENAQQTSEKQSGVDHESILTLDVEQEPRVSANAIQG